MASVALVIADMDVVRDRDKDTAPALAALRLAGVDAAAVYWDDDAVDWPSFDMSVLRCPWDYTYRLEEFLAWLDSAAQVTQIVNSPRLVRWNLDKRYLADIAGHGARVVPTSFCLTQSEVREAIAATGAQQVVVKPSVSAGSRDTGLFRADDPRAIELAAHILETGKTVMVQPAVPSVATVGERALLYFGGTFSHAISKGPLLEVGGGLLGGEYGEVITPVTPTDDERHVADDVMRAIAEEMRARGATDKDIVPLYGRLDLVTLDDGRPALLEAELFEPQLFFHAAPGAVDAYVAAILERLHSARDRRLER